MTSLSGRIHALLNIHPSETRRAVLVFGVMLTTSAGFALGSTGIETLFFTRFGVENLPVMYMLLGMLSFLTVLGITALFGRIHRENLYVLIPVVVAVLTVIGWVVLFTRHNLIYPGLWLGKEVANSLITLVVWGVAGTAFDTRQSKRLFPLFNAGRILGAVLGGVGTGLLVKVVDTQNLLLIWTGLLMLSLLLTRTLMKDRLPARADKIVPRRGRRHPSLMQEMSRSYRFILGSPLMRWTSVAAVLFSILFFSIALPFSKTAAAQYPDEKTLAGFLGLFNGLSTAAAFLASIFLANRLYARVGIIHALLGLPLVYLVGFGSLLISNTFLIIVGFRFIQILWLSGIADSAYQAMFYAIPAAHRDKVRAFVDGVPAQAGTILAGVILNFMVGKFTAQHLALLGLVTAALTMVIIGRAGGAYNRAILESLKQGRISIFSSEFHPDTRTTAAALGEMKNPDPAVRRIACEILGHASPPSAIPALVDALKDEDSEVRIAALTSLANLKASSALLEVAALLSDSTQAVRIQAVDSLQIMSPFQYGLKTLLLPLLEDESLQVRVRAIVVLYRIDSSFSSRILLHEIHRTGDENQRILALNALAEIGSPEDLPFFSSELSNQDASIAVRSAAASALGSFGDQAIPGLMKALESDQTAIMTNAASALARIGNPAIPALVKGLWVPVTEDGALQALGQMAIGRESRQIKAYAQMRIRSAIQYEDMRLATREMENDRVRLLADSLGYRARRDGINSLRALSMLDDHETISIAIDNLQSHDPIQISYALESLESIREASLIRPAMRIWEPAQPSHPTSSGQEIINILINGQDAWLRACAIFADDSNSEEIPMEIPTTRSIMERVLILRHVPLLDGLSPMDLQRVAAIAKELIFQEGEMLCEQGDPGDELYVIISGEVRVVTADPEHKEREIARRGAGEVVGEMAIISGETRMASMIAMNEVIVLSLDRLSFESLLRERPDVSLALMRHLYARLRGKD